MYNYSVWKGGGGKLYESKCPYVSNCECVVVCIMTMEHDYLKS